MNRLIRVDEDISGFVENYSIAGIMRNDLSTVKKKSGADPLVSNVVFLLGLGIISAVVVESYKKKT